MTRPLRIEYPGAIYHITSRGNAKQTIFHNDSDRDQFLFQLEAVMKKFNWHCHSFVLMNNHYHLCIETIDPTLSEGMRQLNGVYTQWHNHEHASVGHLFQGRFKAFLIEEQTYFLNVVRYVVLNPIRASMIDNLADYKWSSYRALAGLEQAPSWLTTEKVWGQFTDHALPIKLQYQAYVHSGFGLPSPFLGVQGGIIGSDQFVDEMREKIEQLSGKDTNTAQRMEGRPTLVELFEDIKNTTERDAAISLAINHFLYSGAEVGRFLHLEKSTVCKIAKRG